MTSFTTLWKVYNRIEIVRCERKVLQESEKFYSLVKSFYKTEKSVTWLPKILQKGESATLGRNDLKEYEMFYQREIVLAYLGYWVSGLQPDTATSCYMLHVYRLSLLQSKGNCLWLVNLLHPAMNYNYTIIDYCGLLVTSCYELLQAIG